MLADLPLPDLSNVTATAILGWYAWHTVSKTIPGIVEAFREEAGMMRSECRLERETLYQELAAERLQRHTDHMAIIDALDDLALRISPSSASRSTT